MKLKRISYVIFLIGLSVFMYPHLTKLIFHTENNIEFSSYEDTVSHMSDAEINEQLKELQNYNETLIQYEMPTLEEAGEDYKETEYVDPFIGGVKKEVVNVKSAMKSGVFGYLKIPKINETLPIYLGASVENLANGVAQIEETSLPIGGLGTNSVIAGHRGYNGGKAIFKYLDKLVVGDRFYIHIYDQILTYEVVRTEVIMPNQTEKLNIDPGKDMVTLLTCTPYRVSTHRLLVYAERVMEGLSIDNPFHEDRGQGMISGVLSSSITKEQNVSSSVKNDQLVSYIIVIGGGILWIGTFFLLIKSFFKKKEIESKEN